MPDIKTENVKTFHEKVENILKSRGILKIFIFLFLQGKQIMQNTNKRTDTRRTLGELGDYEDGSNLSSPQNSKNLPPQNLWTLKKIAKNFTIQTWIVRIPAKRF